MASQRITSWFKTQCAAVCRSCDAVVSMTETVCPTCGQSDPARVTMSAVTAVFAFAASAIIAMLQFA